MVYDHDNFMIPDDIPPSPGQIDIIARLLIEAKKPVLYLGSEVARHHGQAAVFELAELLQIPVAEGRLVSHHVFPHRHPLYGGSIQGADLVLSFGGTDQGGGTVPARPAFANETTVIRIGLNSQSLGRNNPFAMAMLANPRLAAGAIVASLKSQATNERLEKIRKSRFGHKPRNTQIAKDRVGRSPIHPDELGYALEQELDKNAILVSENLSGSNQFYSTGFREDEKTWISTSGAGLGWGVGAATGAQIAAPDRQVVCNIGDGSVMYSASGFWTQARYHAPVLTVVCNNRDYQTVRNAYIRYGGMMKSEDRFTGMHLGDPNIDFVGLAKSQGVDGAKIERSADLIPSLKRGIAATKAGEPFLLDIVVAKTGGGRNSDWFQAYNVAEQGKKNPN